MALKKILIVEDEAIPALNIKMLLNDHGYEMVDIAVSGEEAVELTGQTMPDLVLMDIALVGEIDGIEAAEQIIKQFSVPIVYLTAHADRNALERAWKTKPVAFLEKPIEDYQLIEVLGNLFGNVQ
jgi:CheY-like chemotaxis protein